MDAFKNKKGGHIPSSALPSQSYFDSFAEMLANGTLKAVTLAHVVSAKEQEEEEHARPEPSCQLGMHLETKRTFMSEMPTTTEAKVSYSRTSQYSLSPPSVTNNTFANLGIL